MLVRAGLVVGGHLRDGAVGECHRRQRCQFLVRPLDQLQHASHSNRGRAAPTAVRLIDNTLPFMSTILELVAELRRDDPALTYLEPAEDVAFGKFLEFEMTEWNGSVIYVPSEALPLPGRLPGRSFMYRGETHRNPTCRPSLLRNDSDDWQAKAHLLLERVRVAELQLVMRDHPFEKVARRYGFETDYHGLAQHYGIRTSLLDLTSNVEIAAFFACVDWDWEQHSVRRLMDSGTGVLYRCDWSAFGPGFSKFFQPVGFGPGLRPARQHAWTFRLRPDRDFSTMPHVERFEFTHDHTASNAILRRFGGGSHLDPLDCLPSLVGKLNNLPFVTLRALRQTASQDGRPAEEEVERRIEQGASFLNSVLNIELVEDYELCLEDTDMAAAIAQAPLLDGDITKSR